MITSHFCACSEELGEFMEGRGASIPGILTLTSGLSKPFMRLDKYPTLLKELERHMEVEERESLCFFLLRFLSLSTFQCDNVFFPFQEGHPDRTEIQKCMTAFKNLSVSVNCLVSMLKQTGVLWFCHCS